MGRIVEIRSYNLKLGTRADFHKLVIERAVPLLERWQYDVVAYGASAHDDDSYYLIRSFASLEAREQEEDSFYGSDEWRQGPREAILALIENFTTIVIEVDEATLEGLRATPARASLRH